MSDKVTERDDVHVGVGKCGRGWGCVTAALWLGVQVCQHVTMRVCVCVCVCGARCDLCAHGQAVWLYLLWVGQPCL